MQLPPQQLQSGWEAHWDSNYNCVYYFNKATAETQWEMPQSLQAHHDVSQIQHQPAASMQTQAGGVPGAIGLLPQALQGVPPLALHGGMGLGLVGQGHGMAGSFMLPAALQQQNAIAQHQQQLAQMHAGQGQLQYVTGMYGGQQNLDTYSQGPLVQQGLINSGEAPRNPDDDKRHVVGKAWIFLSNLPLAATEEEVVSKCEEFGVVVFCVFLPPKPERRVTPGAPNKSGFVLFSTMREAGKAIQELDGKPWAGKQEFIIQARFRQGVFGISDHQLSTDKKIAVSDIPYYATQEELHKIFHENLSGVALIEYHRKLNTKTFCRSTCFIQFATLSDAQKALSIIPNLFYDNLVPYPFKATVAGQSQELLWVNGEETDEDELWLKIRAANGTLEGVTQWVKEADALGMVVLIREDTPRGTWTILVGDILAAVGFWKKLKAVVPPGVAIELHSKGSGSKRPNYADCLPAQNKRMIMQSFDDSVTLNMLRDEVKKIGGLLDITPRSEGSFWVRTASAAVSDRIKNTFVESGPLKMKFKNHQYASNISKMNTRPFSICLTNVPEQAGVAEITAILKETGLEMFIDREIGISVRRDVTGRMAFVVFRNEFVALRAQEILNGQLLCGVPLHVVNPKLPYILGKFTGLPPTATAADVILFLKKIQIESGKPSEDEAGRLAPEFVHIWDELECTGRVRQLGRCATFHTTRVIEIMEMVVGGKKPNVLGVECNFDPYPMERDYWPTMPKEVHDVVYTPIKKMKTEDGPRGRGRGGFEDRPDRRISQGRGRGRGTGFGFM